MADGSPPAQVMLRAASATAIAQPTCGSALTYRALQSTVKAMAFLVPLIATTAASLGRLAVIVAVPTIESYCWVTQRLEAIFGCDSKWRPTSRKSAGSATSSILNFL